MPYNSGPFNVISRSTVSYLQIYPGMTQSMDMTAMTKIFISNSIIDFKKW